MSATDVRIPLAEARQLASAVAQDLAPHCERIEIAGSIRRLKADIGDAELVVVPKMAPEAYDLFGEPTGQRNLLVEHLQKCLEGGRYELRPSGEDGRTAFGPRYQRLKYKGFGVDVWGVLPPAQFGVVFMIRTGSDDFVKRMVRQRVMGGEVLLTGQRIENGALWDLGKIVPTPEEMDFFHAVNRPWLPPECRIS
jgi:DNA polymerase/3'-5' exonuclease PolX